MARETSICGNAQSTITMVTTIYVGYVDTRHFEFVSLGLSEQHAKDALMRGWFAHCRQHTDADPKHIAPDDIRCLALAVGQCARDGFALTEPDYRLIDPFTDGERTTLFEAARIGLSDGDTFDDLAEQMDMTDSAMVDLREKLNDFMSSEAPTYGGTFVVCEVIEQSPSVAVFYEEKAALEHAVQCAVENLTTPGSSGDELEAAREDFRLSLRLDESIREGDYEVYILTPNN